MAGGLGLVGIVNDMSELRTQLDLAKSKLKSSPSPTSTSGDTLPIGVGLLPFIAKLEDVLPVLTDYKPVVVWLFAAQQIDDYAEWSSAIRKACPETKIWIQTGSVHSALHISRSASPDALILQGSDAGGHGYERGASIISLLPETRDTLAKEGFPDISLIASGGIVDGRGVAAALALGAQGIVMGTRFLASEEIVIHPKYQAAVLEASDGGQATVRSKVFDELRGKNIWPEEYDGRSLVVTSYRDWVEGMGIEDVRKLYAEEVGREPERRGYEVGGKGRAAIWAGTGVGLVGEVMGAGRIVESVREEARRVLEGL